MRLDIFHLEALSAFHFGERGVGIEESTDHAPSDTMFSALCHVLLTTSTRTALEDTLEAFRTRRPPFLISGGFPYVLLGDAPLRFYPAPATFSLMPSGKLDSMQSAEFSRMRKARWLSETLFFAWLNSDLTAAKLVNEAVKLHEDTLVTKQENTQLEDQYHLPSETPRLWMVDEVPRVAVDRVTNASNVYQVGRLTFARGGGLWCACVCLDWNMGRIRELLTWMGHTGLGGERSSGHGQFEVVAAPANLNVPSPADTSHFVTMSHYRPSTAERAVFGERAAYTLLLRRGWMDSPDVQGLRRPSVRMVAAGSVLHSQPNTNLYGELVDATPAIFQNKPNWHRVWRYGYALAIGIPST